MLGEQVPAAGVVTLDLGVISGNECLPGWLFSLFHLQEGPSGYRSRCCDVVSRLTTLLTLQYYCQK